MHHRAVDPKHIEALHLLSTAPREQHDYDGWLVRRARDDVKRARSANAVGDSTLPLAEKIEHVEALYEEAGLPPLYRLTPFSSPPELDAALEHRAYERIDPSLQQVSRIADNPPETPPGIRFEAHPIDAWQAVAGPMRGQSIAARAAEHRRLSQAGLPMTCMLACVGNEPVACGLALQLEGFVTLMDIHVAEARRGQGFGTAITAELLRGAHANDAEVACLNVLAENTPAIRTYAKLGFQTLYTYWYRIKP